MSESRWTTSNKAVFNLGYHLIWCPKYRRQVLTDQVEIRLRELLIEKAVTVGVTIETMQIIPDQVRLLIKTTPVNSPHYIVQQFKAYTSRILRQEFQDLRTRLPTLWTRSYYIESVGHICDATIKKFIENQKNQ